jgi:hypothetical protein
VLVSWKLVTVSGWVRYDKRMDHHSHHIEAGGYHHHHHHQQPHHDHHNINNSPYPPLLQPPQHLVVEPHNIHLPPHQHHQHHQHHQQHHQQISPHSLLYPSSPGAAGAAAGGGTSAGGGLATATTSASAASASSSYDEDTSSLLNERLNTGKPVNPNDVLSGRGKLSFNHGAFFPPNQSLFVPLLPATNTMKLLSDTESQQTYTIL